MADYGSLEDPMGVYDYSEDIRYQLMNATEEQRANLLLALRSKMEITDVLPPPNHEDLQVLIMAVAYMLLFLLGTCGNVAVLTTIYHVIRSRRATLDNTLIYVIVLSCVDFGVCLSLPFTVIDQILGFWMFGSVVCKLHAVLENFGKILSALILTAMSFDRYAGVCHPQKKWLRSSSLAVCILIEGKSEQFNKKAFDLGRIRTCNLRFRRPTRYPLRHEANELEVAADPNVLLFRFSTFCRFHNVKRLTSSIVSSRTK
uniref:G_PROTEIN_RECEP_F1_2 domain-containing protein n=2 Tax=Steinernema glaseri TaxID=37863 RepID=A0A1I8AH38_9BILA